VADFRPCFKARALFLPAKVHSETELATFSFVLSVSFEFKVKCYSGFHKIPSFKPSDFFVSPLNFYFIFLVLVTFNLAYKEVEDSLMYQSI